MLNDAMVQKHNLHKNYQVVTPGKKNWVNGPLVGADSIWLTDSCKTGREGRVRIYEKI